MDQSKRKRKVSVNDINLEMDEDDKSESEDEAISIRQENVLLGNSSSNIGGKLKVGAMNELQKYKEIQRRTKLLYGVKDVKRMMEKSDASKHFYQRDITYIKILKAE